MNIGEWLGQLFGMLFGFGFLVLLFGIGFIALLAFIITWIVKKVWYAGEKQPNQCKNTTAKNNEYKGNPKENVKWYPTGWTYNDKTKLWEPPDYLSKETSEKWKWDPDKRIWIDKDKEARMEKYRKYHEGQPPTFEEWKAQREKEKQEQQK